jgi:uncharacterized integral membrane protein (TIGR00697 family)
MLQITPEPLFLYLQSLSPELVSIFTLLICYTAIIILTKFWQDAGLFIYSAVAVIACNLQVLKAAEFSWQNEPIALGTIVYSSMFLASDVMTELYGAPRARRSVFLSFAASIVFLSFMILALGLKPLNIAATSEYVHFNKAHDALAIIFSPSAAILIASLSAYILSQLIDILIFSKLKTLTHSHYLWLRTFCAVAVAAFIDSVIFNLLAWKIFAPAPVSWHSLAFTYITGAYILQLLVFLFNIPAFYILLKVVKR